MKLVQNRAQAFGKASSSKTASMGVLAMTPERLAYEGHTGVRSVRALGAFALYSSVDGPVRVWANGRWGSEAETVLVEPFTEHLVSSRRHITEILLEVESVSHEGVRACWQGRGASRRAAEAIRACQNDIGVLQEQGFDKLFFGLDLPRRDLDPRIAAVVSRLCSTPSAPTISVKELAAEVNLSPSRLTHLFGEQLGTTIRRFRAWKRARMVVPIALEEDNLLNLALEAGYADATHFSHSMRSFFGLRARDLCEGSRRANFSMIPPSNVYRSPMWA